MKQLLYIGLIAIFASCNDAGVQVTNDSGSPTLDAAGDLAVAPDDGTSPDTGSTGGSDVADLGAPALDTDTPDTNVPDLPVTPVGSPGCIDGTGIAEGENTFMLEGRNRRYIMRLPNNYTRDKQWPLVLALHGNGGSTSYWDGTSGDRNIRGVLADEAILVVAEAIGGNWRDYAEEPSTWPARIDSELLYFDEIINQASNELCINPSAIFAMGFSGGGSFSGVLGCLRTDIRAIAVGGSVIYFDPESCVSTPASWITIGTLELVPGREAYRDFFRDRAGCATTASAIDPAPCTAYDNCDAATPVHYCQHPGDHIWPDFGSQAMWDFFKRFL